MNTIIEHRSTVIIAAEINTIKEMTQKTMLYNSIEIGRRLAEAKTIVQHGEWGKWLEESVEYSQSTANNLVKIFEEYGDKQITLFGDNANSQALGNLSYTQAVALLGIPSEEREAFAQENEGKSTRELQDAIKEKKLLEKKVREITEKAEKDRKEKQEMAIQVQQLQNESKGQTELVTKLKNDLEIAMASGNSDEAKKLQATLDKSNKDLESVQKKAKELEAQLQEKPKIPESVEKELADLRKKAASSKQEVKFQVCFDSVVKGFDALLGALGEIKTADPEAHTKYTKAVLGLMDKMAKSLKPAE